MDQTDNKTPPPREPIEPAPWPGYPHPPVTTDFAAAQRLNNRLEAEGKMVDLLKRRAGARLDELPNEYRRLFGKFLAENPKTDRHISVTLFEEFYNWCISYGVKH